MKTYLFIIAACLMIAQPTCLFAQDIPPKDPDDIPHFIPPQIPFDVSFNDETCEMSLFFRQDLNLATLSIYKDGILVVSDNMTNIQAGSSTAYNLSLYGTGTFTAYIRIGERTYAFFEEEIVE